MSDTPYFSIIIPLYNAERYIKICIDSILVQTFPDFEVIVVDDCSTDNSYKLCTELYGGNEKVRLFRHEKNQGPGPARNTGIENARGEYIWFVDSDDAIIPTALEKIQKATKIQSDIDAVHIKGWYSTNQEDDKPLDTRKIFLNWEGNQNVGFLTEDIPRRLAENWATTRILGYTWSVTYRKNFLLEHKIKFSDKTIYCEDQIFHLKSMSFAKKFFILKDATYIYRVRKSSLSHKADIVLGIKGILVILREMRKILDEIPEIEGNRILKEQCIISTLNAVFRDHARPLYDGVNIPPELDQAVYETLLPIFGENTTLVKHLFHGYNNMWKQAQIFEMQRNYLAQQNYLLQQKDALIKQQNKLIEQMSEIINVTRRNF